MVNGGCGDDSLIVMHEGGVKNARGGSGGGVDNMRVG